MVELIGKWLVGVTCAAMFVALAEGLAPPGAGRKICRLTGGLVLLLAVVQPVLKLDSAALTRALTQYKLEVEDYRADLEEENAQVMQAIIEEQAGAYIQDKAQEMGIDCQVQVRARGEDYPIPHTVIVRGSLTQEQQEALTREIETDFAIPAQQQIYESGETT
jgi:hypothetical protein